MPDDGHPVSCVEFLNAAALFRSLTPVNLSVIPLSLIPLSLIPLSLILLPCVSLSFIRFHSADVQAFSSAVPAKCISVEKAGNPHYPLRFSSGCSAKQVSWILP